jgi:glycosyltransferase involved in cell wall biosynthesis
VSRGEPPRISVIVPTRDRPHALARCLEALAAQTVADTLEVIVVDDGSIAARAVRETVNLHRRARLVRAAGAGPAAARNLGVRHARGPALCFTDDDCVPDEEWAERLAEALDRGADAAAGTTLSGGGALGEASELVAHAPAAAAGDGSLQFAPSNNLACQKRVFEAIQFDESYPIALVTSFALRSTLVSSTTKTSLRAHSSVSSSGTAKARTGFAAEATNAGPSNLEASTRRFCGVDSPRASAWVFL